MEQIARKIACGYDKAAKMDGVRFEMLMTLCLP
jgi:HJR/Mrr/RecB family endonuclease